MPKTDEEEITSDWVKEAQKGYMRVAALIVINKKPAHGYEIMKEIKDRTKGFWKPTAGGMYPILRDLEKTGYTNGEWTTQNNRKLKVYKITETGKAILKKALIKQNEIANNMNSLFQEFAKEVLNVEATKLPMPIMPSPFSAFLEDENEKRALTKAALQKRCQHLKQSIKMLRTEVKSIEKEIEAKEVNANQNKKFKV
jgi:DNA-binding PadR family transcriptional regulator